MSDPIDSPEMRRALALDAEKLRGFGIDPMTGAAPVSRAPQDEALGRAWLANYNSGARREGHPEHSVHYDDLSLPVRYLLDSLLLQHAALRASLPLSPQPQHDKRAAYVMAMRLMQSDFYDTADDELRAAIDASIMGADSATMPSFSDRPQERPPFNGRTPRQYEHDKQTKREAYEACAKLVCDQCAAYRERKDFAGDIGWSSVHIYRGDCYNSEVGCDAAPIWKALRGSEEEGK